MNPLLGRSLCRCTPEIIVMIWNNSVSLCLFTEVKDISKCVITVVEDTLICLLAEIEAISMRCLTSQKETTNSSFESSTQALNT